MQGERAPVRVRVPARRPEERAGAGHHHRHGALLLQHAAAPLHHPRRPGPRGVPQEHDHRRLARPGGAARDRRARGRARELQAPRLHPLDARHPPDQRAGQQDGPAGLGPGQVRGDRRPSTPTSSARLGVHPTSFIPISARDGDNIVARAAEAPWYDGPTVLEQVEDVQAARRRPRPAVPHAAAGRLQVHRGAATTGASSSAPSRPGASAPATTSSSCRRASTRRSRRSRRCRARGRTRRTPARPPASRSRRRCTPSRASCMVRADQAGAARSRRASAPTSSG